MKSGEVSFDPFTIKYELPDLANKKVLVLGLGGGCDVLAAYALAKVMKDRWSTSSVTYANCIGPRACLQSDHPPVSSSTPHILRVPGTEPRPFTKDDAGWGATWVEQSLPRSATCTPTNKDGSPWLVVLPSKSLDVAIATRENSVVGFELRTFGFDAIIGVDNGGDSLTGGIDFKGGNPELGRDRQVVRLLTSSDMGLRIPFVHLVAGPCCDGESSFVDMRRAIMALHARGQYRGVFSIEPLLPVLRQVSASVSKDRTPNIIIHSYDFHKELEITATEAKALDNNPNSKTSVASTGLATTTTTPASTSNGLRTDVSDCWQRVPRHLRPIVPRSWLISIFAFQY